MGPTNESGLALSRTMSSGALGFIIHRLARNRRATGKLKKIGRGARTVLSKHCNANISQRLQMKRILLFTSAVTFLTLALGAADSTSKDDITGAAKKLAEKDNYSWRTTVVVPENSPFKPGPIEGKAAKDGIALLNMTFGDNETKAVLKGDKAAA